MKNYSKIYNDLREEITSSICEMYDKCEKPMTFTGEIRIYVEWDNGYILAKCQIVDIHSDVQEFDAYIDDGDIFPYNFSELTMESLLYIHKLLCIELGLSNC